ncbi:hypothetical protein VOI54_10860 [Tamlana sp. 2201CG12-4]|uniref:hypothetical protein n=1 Tax=Tamlana sp. 2201CG12-4 TaxID=3112582 RepID=UPI002DBBFA83|nr:hypothetical protein [Tamlana sp. 2201CG12-4]MEC3907519.1 hypothetical protein [Tamlana sp. 2201CG12-4]
MKVFTARAKRGKLKYYDEHISFMLDGSKEYNWRKIQNEIINCSELSLPINLEFTTSKCKFKDLDSLDWAKSDFMIPILHNRLIEILKELGTTDFKTYPITVYDSKNKENVNNNFSAVYINNYLDCIDKESSEPIPNQESEKYDYRNVILKDIEFPVLFKIKGISTPFMHFSTEENIKLLEKNGANGFDFKGFG